MGTLGSPGRFEEAWEALGSAESPGEPWAAPGSLGRGSGLLGRPGFGEHLGTLGSPGRLEEPWGALGSAGEPWGALAGPGEPWPPLGSPGRPCTPP